MPPRFVYWTILAGGLPTAFRATDREELLPTFKRIQEKHPDAELRYFARGKLWASPEEAKAALRRDDAPRESRGRDWRPGGTHKDPRQKFKDAKKDRNQRWRKEKHERRTGAGRDAARPAERRRPPQDRPTFEPRGPRKPHGDPLRKPARPERPFGTRPAGRPRTSGQTRPAGRTRPPASGPAKPRAPYKTRWQKEQEEMEKKKRGRS